MTIFVLSDLVFSEIQTAQTTVMFDAPYDWMQEMKRTKGICRIVTKNENFELSTK